MRSNVTSGETAEILKVELSEGLMGPWVVVGMGDFLWTKGDLFVIWSTI